MVRPKALRELLKVYSDLDNASFKTAMGKFVQRCKEYLNRMKQQDADSGRVILEYLNRMKQQDADSGRLMFGMSDTRHN
jgi:hypothetical protein